MFLQVEDYGGKEPTEKDAEDAMKFIREFRIFQEAEKNVKDTRTVSDYFGTMSGCWKTVLEDDY